MCYSLGSSNLVVHCPSSSRRIRRSDAAEDLFDVVNEALAVSRGRIDPAKRSGSTSHQGDRKDCYRNDRLPKTTTVQSAVKDYYVYNRPSKTTAVSTVPKATVNGSAKDSFRLLSHWIVVVLCAFEKNIRLTHNLSLRAQLLARRPNMSIN